MAILYLKNLKKHRKKQNIQLIRSNVICHLSINQLYVKSQPLDVRIYYNFNTTNDTAKLTCSGGELTTHL